MSFQELIRRRYSVRAYKPDPVGEDQLKKILEAARLAPTAANKQAFRVVVVRTKGREEALRRVYAREWFVQPPLVLAVCAVPALSWIRKDGRNYSDVDAAIVMIENITRHIEAGEPPLPSSDPSGRSAPIWIVLRLQAPPDISGELRYEEREEVLDALEKDHEFLLKGDVFTRDFLDMWVATKRKEHDALRRYADLLGQSILADLQRLQKLLHQNLARMNWCNLSGTHVLPFQW